jgi:predicted Zn-dependent protease
MAVTRTASVKPDPKLSHAVAVMMSGRTADAEKLLRLLVRNQPKHLSAWALLSEILMNRGETKEVRDTVLPAMRAASSQGDSTLADMTEGCLLLRANPSRPAEARTYFERALSKNPTLPVAGDQLLRADRLSGDAAQTGADALKIIAGNPGHTEANAILGSLSLGQKQYAEAEGYLRQSIKSQPTTGALNDLAELLRRQGKLEEAERQARLAIQAAPGFCPAWDTLGNVLLEAGRLEAAYGPLHCALALGTSDPRLYLTLARLRIKQGQTQEAGRILEALKPLLGKTSASVRNEHAELMCRL